MVCPAVFLFQDNLSKYQWIFTKLGMCIDIVEIWFGIANGLIFSQSVYLIQVVDTNSNTEWQTVQIQISWLLLDLHCLQMQGISGFSRTRVKSDF